jgi:hypothetical protein
MKEIEDLSQQLDEISFYRKKAMSLSKTGYWYWDVEKDYLWWDDVMFEIYNQNQSHFSSKVSFWEGCLDPKQYRDTVELLNNAVQTKTRFFTTFFINDLDGESREIFASGGVFLDQKGKVKAISGTNILIPTNYKMRIRHATERCCIDCPSLSLKKS